jgi:Zn-dependent peptidase ImmA (M78 family)
MSLYLELERQKEIDYVINVMLLESGLSYPQNTILDFVHYLNLNVFEIDISEFGQGVKGIIDYGKKYIYIEKKQSEESKRFSIMHEVGHYLLHQVEDGLKYRVDKYIFNEPTKESVEEMEANYFAASFLMPKEDFIELNEKIDDVNLIAKYFGVSLSALRVRKEWLKHNQ